MQVLILAFFSYCALSYRYHRKGRFKKRARVLSSERKFIPLEDILTNEILLIGKTEIVYLSLPSGENFSDKLEAVAIPAEVELLNGEVMQGKFITDLPPDKLRLSDFLNHTPQYILLWRDQHSLILNKGYILSVKQAD